MDREVTGNNSDNSKNRVISFQQKFDLFRPYYIAIINYNNKNVENNYHDKIVNIDDNNRHNYYYYYYHNKNVKSVFILMISIMVITNLIVIWKSLQ